MTHEIHKYSKNRKLYSRVFSRFINLSEVFDLAKQGVVIKVSDDNGNDITAKTLTKAMLTAQFTTQEIASAIETQGEF
jgi:polyhydroxyalkanoate synthesis regulator protein